MVLQIFSYKSSIMVRKLPAGQSEKLCWIWRISKTGGEAGAVGLGEERNEILEENGLFGSQATKKGIYDVCWWNIHIQKWKWKRANISIKFTEIQDGINIYLYGSRGDDASNLVKSLVPGANQNPKIGKEYTVDSDMYNITVIAVPKEGEIWTNFEFEFKIIDGLEFPYYEQFFEHIKARNDPNAFLAIFLSIITLLTLLAGITIGFTISKFLRNKANKVNILNLATATEDKSSYQSGTDDKTEK